MCLEIPQVHTKTINKFGVSSVSIVRLDFEWFMAMMNKRIQTAPKSSEIRTSFWPFTAPPTTCHEMIGAPRDLERWIVLPFKMLGQDPPHFQNAWGSSRAFLYLQRAVFGLTEPWWNWRTNWTLVQQWGIPFFIWNESETLSPCQPRPKYLFQF